MAAGKRIGHAAWFPAATFELRLFAKTSDSRQSAQGKTAAESQSLHFED